MRISAKVSSLALLLLFAGCHAPESSSSAPKFATTPSGLGVVDLVVGTGPTPKLAQTCVMEAFGWVEEKGAKGHLFLDTRKRGYPITFPLGVGRVIAGWDEGVATMKLGGKRLLRVPPSLGYNRMEVGTDIPPGTSLIFELELVEIH
jgi:peptidylprolyl isomerase